MSEPPSSLPQQQPPSSAQLPPSSSTPQPTSSSEATVVPKTEPDVADAALGSSIEQDTEVMANNSAGNSAGAAGDAVAAGEEIGNPVQATSVDAAATSKKETSLREFLGKMDEYAPIVRHRHSHPLLLSSSTSTFLLYSSFKENN
ncbi:hypothetical protein BDV06DRAFT_190311 [Aspergillus oleicola]